MKKTWIVVIVALVLVLALAVGAVIWIGTRDGGQQPSVPEESEVQETAGNGDNATIPPAKDPSEQDPGYEYVDNTNAATEPAEQTTEKPTEQPTEQPTEGETQQWPSVGPNQTPWG